MLQEKHFIKHNRPRTIRALRAELLTTFAEMREKRDRAICRFRPNDADRQFIAPLDGLSPYQGSRLASDGVGRIKLVNRLWRALKPQLAVDHLCQRLHVTIADHNWATSDECTVIDLARIEREVRPMLDQIAPDWHAVIELQAWTNLRHPAGGKLLTPHVHAIAWGRVAEFQARRLADRVNIRLHATLPGADAMLSQLIGPGWIEAARVIRYGLKAHNRCKTAYLNPNRGRYTTHESETGDRVVRYLRMFQIHSLIPQRQLLFGAGTGEAIQRWALERGDRFHRDGPHLSSEAVEGFWDVAMPRWGGKRFQPPEIVFRPL